MKLDRNGMCRVLKTISVLELHSPRDGWVRGDIFYPVLQQGDGFMWYQIWILSLALCFSIVCWCIERSFFWEVPPPSLEREIKIKIILNIIGEWVNEETSIDWILVSLKYPSWRDVTCHHVKSSSGRMLGLGCDEFWYPSSVITSSEICYQAQH